MEKLIRGKLFCTTNPNILQSAEYNGWLVGKLVDGDIARNQNEFMLSSLLPPPESSYQILDNNNYEAAKQIYLQYLMCEAAERPLCSILSNIIVRPANILLYTDKGANEEFHILDTLAEFFVHMYGIQMGSYNDQGNVAIEFNTATNQQINTNIADILFRNGCIDIRQYSQIMPENAMPGRKSCAMILQSINYRFQTQQEYIYYCRKLLNTIRNDSANQMTSPVLLKQQ